MKIYLVTNLINGKVYVGQTRQALRVRLRQHGYNKSNCTLLFKAIRKYGVENFKIETLYETTCRLVLNFQEKRFIKEYRSFGSEGYNLTTGGESAYTRSEETRQKLSKACKGKGRKHTEESKKKLSASKMGTNNPQFGKKVSQETRLKISQALKGRSRPQAVCDKIRASHNPISDRNLTYRRKTS